MSNGPPPRPPGGDAVLPWAELAEAALTAEGLDEFGAAGPSRLAEATGSPWAALYVSDARLPAARFFPFGLTAEAASRIEELCAGRLARACADAGAQAAAPVVCEGAVGDVVLLPLRAGPRCVGLAGLPASGAAADSPDVRTRALGLLARAVNRLVEREQSETQLWHLTTYQTVSSMLPKAMGLHELLEIALQCCMGAVSAEAASVLLLDEEKANFTFYQAEGPAKPALEAATFPADKGLAGDVLRTQKSEVIEDAPSDPRFHGKVDSESGFRTRNMIAVPLTAGDERIGVLEVLNKADGGAFTEDERLLLVAVAEEIAFAIRNAMTFEYVVNTYCKQRRGLMSCKGCKRPLGSWTPCVRYREAGI